VSLGEVFFSELIGTGMLILLGGGVVANVLLAKSKGKDGGWLLINFGWGFAVMAGVFLAYKSGAHLNPAVTIGILASGADTYAADVDITFGSTLVYFAGQMTGAFVGACLVFLAYRKQFEAEEEEQKKLWVFSTAPEVRSNTWNLVTEIIGTFVLVIVVLSFGNTPHQLGPLAVALLVSASAPRSVAPPATPSTRPVTSLPASRTRCCPCSTGRRRTGPPWVSAQRPPRSFPRPGSTRTPTGATHGSRWSARSSAAPSPVCCPRSSSKPARYRKDSR
jgi:glycerol uptake facilitator protein